MTLRSGVKLGSYEILSPIGSGGMGEVYRARDAKLKREVAIKILPGRVSTDPQYIARFQREAEVLASLNHTNIAGIYDLQETGDSRYLVLEFVEGETLQHRLGRGLLPLDEALSVARQICHALGSAHEKGVVHLDLKPANIMMTSSGRVKLLDFGLASMLRSDATTDDSSNLPTVTGTREGVIAGTPAYMSPEQARGKPTDKRTDMWAFGCVLYEMLAGRQLFSAETVTDTLAAIITKEPDLGAIPVAVPLQVRLLLTHCLQKDPDVRFRDASDAVALLNSAELPVSERATKRRSWIPLAAMAIGLLAALVPAFLYFRSPVPASRLIRFEIPMPAPAILFSIAVSPDGRRVAYIAPNNGKPALWVHSLDSLAAQMVPGTEGQVTPACLAGPFWSPEGRFIAFASDHKLKKIDILGGPPQTLTALDVNCIGGGTWNRDGVIIFASNGHGLRRLSASGGEAVEISERDKSLDETYHDCPWFLPDGRHFLYLGWSETMPENRAIYIGSLDSKTRTRLMTAESNVMYSPPGFLLFMREGTLLARPFDVKRLAFTGQELPVAEHVNMDPANEIGAFAVSEEGTLIYRKKAGDGGDRELVWFNRDGKAAEVVGSPLQSTGSNVFSLSRDGRLVAFSAAFQGTPGADIWIEDIQRSVRTRVTTDPATDHNPVWSPDGSQLVFDSHRTTANASAPPAAAAEQAVSALYIKASTGATPESLLLPPEPGIAVAPRDWSSDGRYILFGKSKTGQPPWDIWVLPLFGDKTPFPFITTPFNEVQPALSPNGRWLAYVSNEPGSNEVIVQPFPDGTKGKWQISTEGGASPRWSRDGRELFYLDLKGRLFVVPVKSDGNFEIGKASLLFDTHLGGSASAYEVSADGKRFLIAAPRRGSDASPPITVHLNWSAGLKP